MTTRLVTGRHEPWKAITAAARKSPRADVAVAYFAKGAAELLPIGPGSRLVVNLSLNALKAGATCPEELIKLAQNDVAIYDEPQLHAKIFAFGRSAFIGSANVSKKSQSTLFEAVVEVTDAKAVREAHAFVRRLCVGVPLGPEALEILQKDYRPPRGGGDGMPAGTGRRPRDRVRMAHLGSEDEPQGYEDIAAAVEEEGRAKSIDPENYEPWYIWNRGSAHYRENDILVTTQRRGRQRLVSPPARVLSVRSSTDRGPTMSYYAVEQQPGRAIELRRLAKSLGPGWFKRLSKEGAVEQRSVKTLLSWWNTRG